MLEQRVSSRQGRIIPFSCFICFSEFIGLAAAAGGSVSFVTLMRVSLVPWSSTVVGLQPPTTRQLGGVWAEPDLSRRHSAKLVAGGRQAAHVVADDLPAAGGRRGIARSSDDSAPTSMPARPVP